MTAEERLIYQWPKEGREVDISMAEEKLTAKGKLIAVRLIYRWPKGGRKIDGKRERKGS